MRVWHVAILMASLVAAALSGCTHVVTEGGKVGTVIKLAQQGVLCKTWEGEIIRGGMNGGSGAFSTTPLFFTVNDPNILRDVNSALEGQYEVKVHYVEFLGPMGCSSSSNGHFLTRIERLR